MTPGYKKLRGHAYFFRELAAFTLAAPGVCDRDHKPAAADPKWLALGNAEIKTKAAVDTEMIYTGAPGKRVVDDVLETKHDISHEIKLHKLQNLVYELLFGSLPLDEGGQFNPNEGSEVRGWLKLQEYDSNNVLVATHDTFVYLKPPSEIDRTGEKHVEATIEAIQLYSTLNTGNLSV
jgi:hypothetical protein